MKNYQVALVSILPTFIIAFCLGFWSMGMDMTPDFTFTNKETAVVKTLGFSVKELEIVKERYVITELRQVDRLFKQTTWEFLTLNDTKTRQLIVEDVYPMVGDVVTFVKTTYKKDCDLGVQLQPPDFEPIWFEKIDARNFTISELPKYYTDKYTIVVNLDTCFNKAYRTYSLLDSDGKQQRMEYDSVGFEF